MEKPIILDRKLKYKGRAFEVYEYSIQIFGEKIKRDIFERKHGVVVVPVDKSHNVLVISEYCAGSNSFVLSLPGGKASGKTEHDFINEAQRELREETGYRANQMIKLRFAYSHPCTSTRRSHVFLGYDLEKDPLPDSGEFIDIVKMPLDDAIKACYKDFASDVSTIGNLLMARDKIIDMGL